MHGFVSQEAPAKPLPNPLMPNFWAVLALIGVMLANALMWFIQRWLLAVRAAVKYAGAKRMEKGSYLFISPHAHQVRPIASKRSVIEGEACGSAERA
jgi:hypothetical protein